MYRVHEIRLVMKCLENMTEKYGYAIVLIDHTNKSMGVNRPIGLGSIDFQATAKSVLIAVRIKDDSAIRGLAHDKSNLAPEVVSIAFILKKDWFFMGGSLYQLINCCQESAEDKTTDAKAFLTKMQAEGQGLCNEIKKAAAGFVI